MTMRSDLFWFALVFIQPILVTKCVTPDKREVKSTIISDYEVEVRAKTPIHITGDRFLSVAVDVGTLNKQWLNFNISSPKLQTMTRALSPAYLRLGGRAADFLLFKNPCDGSEPSSVDSEVGDPLTYLCPQDWDGINDFCSETGLKLVFGLNLLQRTEAGGWSPDNAEKLLDYNTHDVAWELGNEPNSFKRKANITLSGSQIGTDFNLLRTVLDQRARYAGAPVFGPDIGGVVIGRKKTTAMLEGFLSNTNTTNATTFHSYYLNGRAAIVDDFLNPGTLDGLLPGQINLVESLVSKHRGPGSRVWLGETGSAFGGGAPNISDRFVAGFLFLDKLGMSARMGLETVIRQSYYGGSYTMLDLDNLDPKPDYWIAYIYKRLVGRRVLLVKITPPSTGSTGVSGVDKQYVRVYAHCTATTHSGYDAGAVTLIVLNMHKAETANIALVRKLGGRTIHQYLLTPHGPEGMTSLEVSLNDSPLYLKSDTTLPEIKPVRIKRGKPILVPPVSYGFYVVPKAKAKACLN